MKNRKTEKIRQIVMTAGFFIAAFATIGFSASSGTLPSFLTDGGKKFLAVAQYLTVIAGSAAFCFMGYALWQGGELANYMGRCLAIVIGCIVGFHAEDMLTHFCGTAALIDYIPAPQESEIMLMALAVTILFVARESSKTKKAAAAAA